MNNNPLNGPKYLLRGIGIIARPRLRRFVLIPLLINMVLFAGLLWVMFLGMEWLAGEMGAWLPDWLDWLTYLLWPVYVIAGLLLPVFGFVVVGNLIASPFNGLLAEAVEQELTGRPISGASGWRALAAEIGRTIRSELRKLGYTAVRAIPILILLLIPGLNVIGSMLWLVFGAWLMAIQYADYPMGNHGISFPEQRATLARARLLSMGFGGSVMFLMMIPLVNFIAMPASVAAATALWVDEFSKSELPPPD